jgi:hypothetical protein
MVSAYVFQFRAACRKHKFEPRQKIVRPVNMACKDGKRILLFIFCFCSVCVVPAVTVMSPSCYEAVMSFCYFCSQSAVLEVCSNGCRK